MSPLRQPRWLCSAGLIRFRARRDARRRLFAEALEGRLLLTAVPQITLIDPDTGWSDSDGITSSSGLAVIGTAEPGTIVALSESTIGSIGSATTNANWDWSVPTDAFVDGSYSFTAIATDPEGNPSDSSRPFAVVVDTIAPAAPQITGITPDCGASNSDGVTNATNLTLTGVGGPGTRIEVTETSLGNVGTVIIDDEGHWSVAVGGPLSDGNFQFAAVSSDTAGNISGASPTFVASVDTVAPAAPVISGISPDTGFDNHDGVTSASSITIGGTAEVGAVVAVAETALGDVGTTAADSDGNWIVTVTGPLADGNYQFSAVGTDLAGNVSTPSAPLPVTVDTLSPSAPSISTLQRDMSDLEHLALVATGTAEPETRVQLSQTGTTNTWDTTTDADGNWSITTGAVAAISGSVQLSAVATDLAGNSGTPATPVAFRPNFIIINDDDQRWDEVESFMPQTMSLLAASGTVFQQAFVTTALSGPSRASLLTGQYSQHTGELYNDPPWGGIVNFNDSQTLATVLHDSGYQTGVFGKYDTRTADGRYYGPTTNPPGWDEFHTLVKHGGPAQDSYYGYTLSDNGVLHTYGTSSADYSTSVLSAKVSDFIEQSAANLNRPFFAYLALPAPHEPYLPAPQYYGTLAGLAPNRPPSFNIPDGGGSPLSAGAVAQLDIARQHHLEQLRSVDDAIASLFGTLQSTGQECNTVVLFTADNGYQWGEHSQIGKDREYEESLRVPLIVRDGRAPLAQVRNEFALNIDLAPTLESWAGAPIPATTDGESLAGIVAGETPSWRNDFFVENVDGATRHFMLRTERYAYVESSKGNQLFDLQTDPYELDNLYSSLGGRDLVAQLSTRLHEFMSDDTVGPVITSAVLSVSDRNPSQLRLTVGESDASTGGSQVRSPEYFIDTIGASATGRFVPPASGSFSATTGTASVDFNFSYLSTGRHTLYVHGRDTIGNWGSYSAIPFFVDTEDQIVSLTGLTVGNPDSVTIDVNSGTLRLNDSILGGVVASQISGNGSGQIAINNAGTAALVITLAAAGGLNYTPNSGFVGQDVLQMSIWASGSEQQTEVPIFVLPIYNSASSPTISNLGQTFPYAIGSGMQTIAPIANLQIASGAAANAVLVASFPNFFGGADRLAFRNQGNGPGQVGIVGGTVSYGGLTVGSLSYAAINTGPMIVEFNADATRESIEAVLRAAVYRNVSLTPTLYPRTIQLRVIDGQGAASNFASNVLQPMSISGVATSVVYYASNAPVRMAPSGVLTCNTIPFAGTRLTAVATNGGGADVLSILSLTTPSGQVTVSGNNVLVEGLVVGTFSGGPAQTPLSITFNADARLASVNAVLQALAYSNTSLTPSIFTRNLQIGFTYGNGALVQKMTATPQMPPVVAGLIATGFYRPNGTPLAPAAGTTITDPSALRSGAKLTATLVVGGGADRLNLQNQGTGRGQVGVADTTVTYEGVAVGTFTPGAGTTALIVTFNGNATAAAVEAVARSIIYYNVSRTPSLFNRTFRLSYSNGSGISSVPVSCTIIVNVPPSLTGGGTIVVPVGGTVATLASDLVAGDPDGWYALTTLRVSISGGDANDRLSIAHQGTESGKVGISGNSVTFGGLTVATFSGGTSGADPLLVTFNAQATQATIQAVARVVRYASVSYAPAGTGRTIQFQLIDAGGVGSNVVTVRQAAKRLGVGEKKNYQLWGWPSQPFRP